MSDQAREQILSCLEDVKLDLEEIGQHSSAIVVDQAVEQINSLVLRLEQIRQLANDAGNFNYVETFHEIIGLCAGGVERQTPETIERYGIKQCAECGKPL